MSTKYFALLTHAGTEKLEKAALSGSKLEITHMAVGDGGGSLPTPNASQSGLINETHRAELNALTVDSQKTGQVIAEQILPEGEGNWWVREMGLFDKDGTLVAVGNCADVYKPESEEQTIRMALTFGNSRLTEWIKELISGFATRKFVRDKIKEHAESRDHPNATLAKKGLVALSNEVDNDSEIHAATPKAVKTAYELASQANESVNSILSTNKYVPSTRKVNGKELSKDIELIAADVGAYDKIQTDSLVDGATQSANKALDQLCTKVPVSRTINGKELVADIELTAHDVNTYNKQEINGLIGTVEKLANTANENANDALKQLPNKVSTSRKVNNKELSNDIQLIAADVDAYNKAESDDHLKGVRELADSKVPPSRKVNGKELSDDIQLTAVDIDVYSKTEIDSHIKDVKELAASKVPLTRKVNNK
ncbi:phage tail protein, partial [Xenorhabdus sp. 18]|uniref:phage tail protein n=1 Tax=Xenorhabdus doucetiae TaxID=351671 RepID=UPI00198E1713